ncbi:MAG: hypothetical protein II369_06275, partial [Clostridia bacterium]|nr:hypothetical protein [Clostridia bacterium]
IIFTPFHGRRGFALWGSYIHYSFIFQKWNPQIFGNFIDGRGKVWYNEFVKQGFEKGRVP